MLTQRNETATGAFVVEDAGRFEVGKTYRVIFAACGTGMLPLMPVLKPASLSALNKAFSKIRYIENGARFEVVAVDNSKGVAWYRVKVTPEDKVSRVLAGWFSGKALLNGTFTELVSNERE